MRKLIAAINMTLDGFCDHTAVSPDEEVHQHYAALLEGADIILYGRITFELMKFWQDLVKNPSGDAAMDEFAVAIDSIPKLVFSNTMKDTGWNSAELSDQPLHRTARRLKEQAGKDILVGSRSLIIQLLKAGLVDELQLCIHPVLAAKGLPLFKDINDRMELALTNRKSFKGGATILYLEPPRTSTNNT
jgi:dihydrofolate reductase